MTEDQSKATESIMNMILKFLFGICALVGWCILLYYFIQSKTTFDLAKFGGGGGALTGCIWHVFRHYFGAIRKK